MKSPKFITTLVLIVLLIILLIQNTQAVSLKIYFWQISTPQFILIPVVLLIGFVAGYVVALMTGRSQKKKATHPPL
jgi:uncharacterized integral membrane protein